MNILFDTNVVLDLLLNREPHANLAASLFAKIERGELQGFLAATTLTTLSYLLERSIDRAAARGHIESLLRLFGVAPIDHAVLESAVHAAFGDFEDAVLCMAAKYSALDGIVTRNAKDFKRAQLPIYTPLELVAILGET